MTKAKRPQTSDGWASLINQLCEQRFKTLTDGGCDADVAADRVWDALVCALERQEQHCFDPRDRLFEEALRHMVQIGSGS